jgi:acyl-CoA reductase-like NAD-dependent aldehyde dehydrogenase
MIVDSQGAPTPEVPAARMMLKRARWATKTFAQYDTAMVTQIVQAVAEAAGAEAQRYAHWAVEETGFGVAEHKVIKNLACSTGLLDEYRGLDLATPQVDSSKKIVRVPRPAGVVLALTPSTNPVASIYFKAILALMGRNAVVFSPHPMAKKCCFDAAMMLADAAHAAGAPDGVIQCVEEPSIPLIDALMTDQETDVIVCTGGSAVVRAAYSSGNPALGVGPGNVPAFVDASADIDLAAKTIVESKSFDNSILCTNESAVIVVQSVADELARSMERHGAYFLSGEERDLIRERLFPGGRFDTSTVGVAASKLAADVGLRVGDRTRILVAPIEMVVNEEPLAHEKLTPVLGFVRVPNANQGMTAARELVRIGGMGHSAAIHTANAQQVVDYANLVEVNRVSVNVGNSTGSSGIDTHLAPTMTIGTGFFGRSSLSRNLEPTDLVQWTSAAYSTDDAVAMPEMRGLLPSKSSSTHAMAGSTEARRPTPPAPSKPLRVPAGGSELTDQLRRLIVEELQAFISEGTR